MENFIKIKIKIPSNYFFPLYYWIIDESTIKDKELNNGNIIDEEMKRGRVE